MSSMNMCIGVDIIEIGRIRQAAGRWQDAFLKRIYTQDELDYCGKRYSSLAARFAAKEAVIKALGDTSGMGWHDIEIVSAENDAPQVRLSGGARRRADELGVGGFSVSLSHCENYAVALTVGNAA